MANDLKDRLDKSLNAIEEFEDKVEDYADNLEDEVEELWGDIKNHFTNVAAKLKDATHNLETTTDEAQLQAHLGTMEAHDKLEVLKETVDDFTFKVSTEAHKDIDTVALRAHLAKMDADDYWEEKSKVLTKEYHESSDKVKDVSLQAANDMKVYFDKLLSAFSKSA